MMPAQRTITILAGSVCLLWAGCQPGSNGNSNGRGVRAITASERGDTASTPLSATLAAAAPDSSAEVTDPRWPSGRLDITFDDIRLDLKKDEPFQRSKVTGRIEQLDGRDVRIRGYILPSFRQRGIKEFVLVRDNLECCFGPGAALHDCILVQMKPHRSTSYTVRPVTVEGAFAIRELKGPAGETLAIYHLAGEGVQ